MILHLGSTVQPYEVAIYTLCSVVEKTVKPVKDCVPHTRLQSVQWLPYKKLKNKTIIILQISYIYVMREKHKKNAQTASSLLQV